MRINQSRVSRGSVCITLIIMVSSIAGALGLMGSAGAVAYATAKAGLHGFTLSVAADYATQNIRANCIIVGGLSKDRLP